MAQNKSSSLPLKPTAPANQEVRLAVDSASFLPRQEGVLKAYLEKVRVWHGYARFIGLPALVDTSKDVPLERLYVSPRLSTGAIQPETMNEPADKLPPTLGLLDSLMAHPRLVVLGDPGSGKSTLINYIADSLSRPSHSELRTRLGADIIPLPFILRELGIGEDITWDGLCSAFLARPVGQTLGKDDHERRQNLEALLHSGQGWVMLDGLDEIGSKAARMKLRDELDAAISRFTKTRFLLTSRVVGYDEVRFDGTRVEFKSPDGTLNVGRTAKLKLETPKPLDSVGQAEWESLTGRIASIPHLLYLAPFNDEQVRDFTRHWWMHHRGNPALAAAESEEFLSALHAKKDTRTLGRVPNLLVLIALVYKVFVKLPDGRAELYWKIAEAYLENIDRSYDLKRRLPHGFRQMASWLGHVAWQMQLRRHNEASQEKKNEPDQLRTEILITHAEALSHLTVAIRQDIGSEAESRRLAATFLDYAARRSGLFIPRGVDEHHQELYAFMHLSFQEFFCAVYLQERVGRMSWWRENVFAQKDSSESALAALRQYAARTEWMEVFIFLFEMLQVGDPDKPTDFLRALLDEPQDEQEWRSFDAPFPQIFLDEYKTPVSSPRLSNARLVELVATLAMNSEVRLAPLTRRQLLHHAWEWETRRCMDGNQMLFGSNVVARELMTRRAVLSDSWDALISLGTTVQQLSLDGCTAISDLQPLSGLSSLQSLNLNGCSGITDLQPLQALSLLQFLELTGCSGITDLQPLEVLSSLQSLYLIDCSGITDLEPLQALSSLHYLYLNGCPGITDLRPLQALSLLQFLSLTGCTGITDLQPLRAISSLRSLYINGCTGISDLDPLRVLSSLQRLNLNNCTGITDLKPLQALSALHDLYFNGCLSITDLRPLQALSLLQLLSLTGCTGITDLQPLRALSSLQNLYLTRCTGITDLQPLQSLTLLRGLDLSGCTSVSDLKPLQALASLEYLILKGCTGVKDSSVIAQLKKRNVKVLSS